MSLLLRAVPIIGALLLSTAPALLLAAPVKSANDSDPYYAPDAERAKGFYYGHVYGVGMFLCELAIDQEIDKGYAKRLFSELPNTVKEQAASKYMARYIDLAYNKILQDVVCKEVFQ